MNRRFCAALLLLLLSGAVGAIPMLRAELEPQVPAQSPQGSEATTSQNSSQQADAPLPPLPPLPDSQVGRGTSAAEPASLPWASASGTQNGTDATTTEDGKAQQQVLLHRNGRLFHGEIVDQGDRYIIQLPYGEVELKKTEVEFVGNDVAAVYRHRRDQIEPGSVDRRMALASWCATEKLLEEAEQELAIASGLAPRHPRLPLIARQIELARRELESPPSLSATQGPGIAAPQAHLTEFAGKLPEGSIEAFTEHVQPLLLNSCATAGCHAQGNRKSAFQIQRYSPSQGASQRLTQRNLRSVLRYVDPDTVETSELLTKAIAEHGGSRSAPVGSTDSAQFETLADWVLQVVGRKAKAQQDSPVQTQQATHNANQPVQSRALPAQQAVVRTSDEIRALFSGHSFVEQYDQQHPRQEMVQYGLMGERPAADFPGLQPVLERPATGDEMVRGLESNNGNTPAPGEPFRGSNPLASQPADDLAAKAAANGITEADQALIDQVSNIPPNRIRVGAGDPQNRDDRLKADLGTFRPRDPFDPEIFNRRFSTRPTARSNSAPPAAFHPANTRLGMNPPRPLNANPAIGNVGTPPAIRHNQAPPRHQ